jgi:hypothetical protein
MGICQRYLSRLSFYLTHLFLSLVTTRENGHFGKFPPLEGEPFSMPQYIFVYLGGEYPSSPEEGQKHFEKYQQWLNSLGNAVVSPAVPFKDTHTVQADGTVSPGTMTAMSGLSILRMGSMEEAVAAAQACPFLEINGTLEVSEMIEMTGDSGEGSKGTIN